MSEESQRLIAGAMSGTSADGVDVAIVAIRGRGLEMTASLLRHHHLPYDPLLKDMIFCSRDAGAIRLADLGKMGRQISLTYARAVNEALAASGLSAGDLAAVAAHGQTLFHEPPNTIQWFDPALLAAEVGCAVVSDFRRADCAAGGQGAPLVPFADYILFRHPTKNRALLNIGGIANLTWLKAGGSIDDVIAFDTGPGNCISDWLCRRREPGGRGYDAQGERAARGKADSKTIFAFARNEFIFRRPPRSTDGPTMIRLYEQVAGQTGFSDGFEDELATACACCAYAVQTSLDLLKHWIPGAIVDEILVSGGGTENRAMMNLLRQAIDVRDITCLEPVASQAREAIAFALLGAATLDGVPASVPSATGASRAAVLGSITPRPSVPGDMS